MANTIISDLNFVPEAYLAYQEKLIMERSALFQSGFVVNNPTFIPGEGKMVNAPAFLGFTGASEVASDTTPSVPGKVGSTNAMAAINFRVKSYSANNLVGFLAGADPLGNLASKYANFWVRDYNKTAGAVLVGTTTALDAEFGAGSIILDSSGATISANAVIDAKQLMGEYQDELGIFICHSAVYASLQKTDLTKEDSFQSDGSPIRITRTYMGMPVVIDDSLVPAGAVYTSYIVAAGAMTYAQGIDPSWALREDTDILAGDDIVASRSRNIMHIGGTSFTGASVAGVSSTDAELATAANWTAEDPNEAKRFGVRAVTHLI